MTRIIPKPIHDEIMKEISQYDHDTALDQIIEALFEAKKPKLALWLAVEFERPF